MNIAQFVLKRLIGSPKCCTVILKRGGGFAGSGDGTVPENRPGLISGAIAMSMHPRCICHPSASISSYQYGCMFVYLYIILAHALNLDDIEQPQLICVGLLTAS